MAEFYYYMVVCQSIYGNTCMTRGKPMQASSLGADAASVLDIINCIYGARYSK
jgi:hypothetical protein